MERRSQALQNKQAKVKRRDSSSTTRALTTLQGAAEPGRERAVNASPQLQRARSTPPTPGPLPVRPRSPDGLGVAVRVRPRADAPRAASPNTDQPRPLDQVGAVQESSSRNKMLNALRSRPSSAPRSTQRRQLLEPQAKDSTRAHLTAGIGMRTAKSKRPWQSTVAPQHPLSTNYLRGDGDQFESLFTELGMDEGDYAVNSPKVLERLRMYLPPEDFAKLSILESGQPGLWFLHDSRPRAADPGDATELSFLRQSQLPASDLDKLVEAVGGTPSPYQLFKLLDAGAFKTPIDIRVDARKRHRELLRSAEYTRVKELARTSQTQRPVYGVITHLLDGLSPDSLLRSDPLSDDAVANLRELVGIAARSENDPSVLALTVDQMMDELMVALGSMTPSYKSSDFENALSAAQDERSPALKALLGNPLVERYHYYASSGMDALTTALTIASSERGDVGISRATSSLDYFETTDLLEKLRHGKIVTQAEAGIVIAALHPSSPNVKPDIPALIEKVEEALGRRTGDKPVSLIIDTTIETGGPELNQLWSALNAAIDKGELNVFCCKSFHKYATLGTAKLSSGAMTLVGRRGSGLPAAEVLQHDGALAFDQWPEAQLMTHIIKHAAGDELTLIKAAAANAKFVHELCWPSQPASVHGNYLDSDWDSGYVAGIPLLIRGRNHVNLQPMVDLLNIDQRDSFSFLRTSFLPIIMDRSTVRLNPGQESKEAMVEFFYAVGHLTLEAKPGEALQRKNGKPLFTPAVIFDHLRALDNLPSNAQEAPYAPNIRASYLYFLARIQLGLHALDPLACPVSDTKIRDAIGSFIGTDMVGVTPDMQAELAARYLEQCCFAWPGGDDATARIKKAASLVTREDAAALARALPPGKNPEFGALLKARAA